MSVYKYDGTEIGAPGADFMNLGMTSIEQEFARVDADIAAIDELADSGWVNITTFGPGWSAAANLAPQVRKVGDRVDIDGAVQIAAGGDFLDILTIPEGFRLTTSRQRFVGATVSNNTGAVRGELFITLSHKLTIPTGYRIGGLAAGNILPVRGSYWVN